MSGIQLSVLSCPSCSSSLTSAPESVFFYCPNCGGGFELNAVQELSAVPVYFARYAGGNSAFIPFWAFDAMLNVQQREARQGVKSMLSKNTGLIQVFESRGGAIRFYVPASLEEIRRQESLGVKLTCEQPELQFMDRMPEISAVAVSSEDARKLADTIFLTSEISQKDMLRNLVYQLTLTNPMLLVIGFPG